MSKYGIGIDVVSKLIRARVSRDEEKTNMAWNGLLRIIRGR